MLGSLAAAPGGWMRRRWRRWRTRKRNNPGALAATAAQYQDRPDILHAILGNKALLMAGAGLTAGVMSGQLKPTF